MVCFSLVFQTSFGMTKKFKKTPTKQNRKKGEKKKEVTKDIEIVQAVSQVLD